MTTVDVDFMFRRAPANLLTLKQLAKALGATILRPYDRALVEMIRRRLALPLKQRMNLLRRRVGVRGTAL